MTVTYTLKQFSGPLDLLLHLIDQAKINIQDISIREITDQYMEYLYHIEQLELDITSEFLVMAATLLALKSQQLLPKPIEVEWDDDPYEYDALDDDQLQNELIHQLLAYRKYKAIALYLQKREFERAQLFMKQAEDLTSFMPKVLPNPFVGLCPKDIARIFDRALAKQVRHVLTVTKIHRDEISVQEQMEQMMIVLQSCTGSKQIMFSTLLAQQGSRAQLIVSLLALLELIKQKQIRCYQVTLFADIAIQWIGKVETDG